MFAVHTIRTWSTCLLIVSSFKSHWQNLAAIWLTIATILSAHPVRPRSTCSSIVSSLIFHWWQHLVARNYLALRQDQVHLGCRRVHPSPGYPAYCEINNPIKIQKWLVWTMNSSKFWILPFGTSRSDGSFSASRSRHADVTAIALRTILARWARWKIKSKATDHWQRQKRRFNLCKTYLDQVDNIPWSNCKIPWWLQTGKSWKQRFHAYFIICS